MTDALRFESLACFGEKGGRVAVDGAQVALVRFNRPMTDDEWRAFAETCERFANLRHPLAEMTRLDEEMGLYDEKVPPMNPRHRDVNP